MTTAIAFNAVIAGQRLFANQTEVWPHTRPAPVFQLYQSTLRARFETDIFRHAQIHRVIQRFDELIATVWIAGKIGLANAPVITASALT